MSAPTRFDISARQWLTWKPPGAGITLTGYSRANDKTFFHVPELRCGLDAGLVEGRQPETVFLTHAHADHAADLAYLAARAGGVDVYVPAVMLPRVTDFLRASYALNNAHDVETLPGVRLHGVAGGDSFVFGRRGGHAVRVVDCVHKVPCVGYAFSSVGRALLPEYEELRTRVTPAEFGRLLKERRAAGDEVDRELRRPMFAFLGDTGPRVFDAAPWLLDYPVIVMECTYLDDALATRAEEVGHVVWSGLRPIVEANPSTLFVLTHFSLRHTDAEVMRFFEREAVPNVVPWAIVP
ncbi:hypothetical protein Val02_59210 [Virgisporangium aliadipatigenens]|uniref:Metallo-beta-lactamase domain-containing protein n=1 Tax=Virgisporangium aliadipatigenens TaxID=741659 RepID=A0A8J3YSA4_9ACTN|nr:MBL fold metallo-hydrolase [Virgisporangium aliadipatigenens]GIJ49035.1 hypothetical protein Val02_59210 [Virgisporangium aliadipatigenens]